MMGIETIRQMNAERGMEAAERGLEPYVLDGPAEVDALERFPFPHLGDHRPEGWELIDRHFVDSSGMGADDEPALSARQFKDLLRQKAAAYGRYVGFAIIEAGQFQVYVGEFRKDAVVDSPSGWSFREEQENGDNVDCWYCGDPLNDDYPIENDDDGYAYHAECRRDV